MLMLMAGDVESNPGPGVPGRDCDKCGRKIAEGSRPLLCVQAECVAVCHKTHNKIAEFHPGSWRCSLHRAAIFTCRMVEVESDETETEEDVSEEEEEEEEKKEEEKEEEEEREEDGDVEEAVEEMEEVEEIALAEATTREHGSCQHCKRKFASHHAPVSCTQCNGRWHLTTCTGMKRKAQQAAKINNHQWICGSCTSSSSQVQASSAPPSAPIQEPPGEAQTIAEPVKCPDCKATIKKGHRPVRCTTCSLKWHFGCTKLSNVYAKKDEAGKDIWICNECSKPPPVFKPCPKLDDNVEDDAKDMITESKEYLRILQWNANGLSAKADELEVSLGKLDVDVCLIQETKLRPKHREPSFEKYRMLRFDRETTKVGGGLATLIKKTLPFEEIYKGSKDGTDVQTCRVRMSKNKWMTITNLYCPPVNSKGQDISECIATELIPSLASSFIAGDFNAHCPLWEDDYPEDKRGEQVAEWAMEKELSILNTGAPTRTNIVSGRGTAPDVTLCGKWWNNKCDWYVEGPIGSSDHLPIVTSISCKTHHQPVLGARARWRSQGVDWKEFTKEVEEKMEESMMGVVTNIHERVKRLNSIMMEAAYKHVGKVKPRKKKRNLWLTPTVRGCIRKRNKLRRDLKTNRKEWLDACKETNDAIREAKTECWREVVEGAINSEEEGKVWSFVKTLNGTPDRNSPNEALVVGGRRITSDKRKADAFIDNYAEVSRLKFTRAERRTNLQAKRMLRKQTVNDESCCDFTIEELNKAIQKMKAKGAAGDDEIPPSFLKALGPIARAELLRIFNLSFDRADLPRIWRVASIIPLLKAGKSPRELQSYRPVSLTSCVVKTMERMVANRLQYLAETQGMFNKLQAGFRKGRSCEDQILKVVQRIEDGFQEKKMERSVLVLLDYSKAYDKVWQNKLLLAMDEKGVPHKFLKWIAAFLTDRQARVRFQSSHSKTRVMRQGLPQGAVLSPLLFLFFIDDLAEQLPDDTLNTLFADDVSAVATHRSKEVAMETAQRTVNVVAAWSREWKLDLNAAKSEVAFFSTNTHESTWRPTIKLYDGDLQRLFDDGEEFTFRENPRLLGVILDRQLCFGPQVKHVTGEATKKLRLLRMVSNSEWGASKKFLKNLYQTFGLSKMNYAAPAWQGWLSDSQKARLEVEQNKALRIVTGQYKDTHCDALRKEANICSMATSIRRECAKAGEKAARQPQDHPRRITWEAVSTQRCRKSWRSECKRLQEDLPEALNSREELGTHCRAPWRECQIDVHPELPGLTSRHQDEAVRRQLAIERLEALDGEWTIYTDGSADAGFKDGGSAAVVTRGGPLAPITEHVIMKKGAARTSSYEEEDQAMRDAIAWVRENGHPDQRIVIATDSQSLCSALQNRSPEVNALLNAIEACSASITIQWIPGHSDIPGNELADAHAKEAAQSSGAGRPVSYKSACAEVKRCFVDPPSSHERTREVYSKYSEEKEKSVKNRDDQVLLARLRSGHHMWFMSYRHRIGKRDTAECERCGFGDDDVVHWLACPGTLAARTALFECSTVGLSILTEKPMESITLARRTLRDVEQEDQDAHP